MPNWVYNSLTIEGDSALIADVKRLLNRPFVQNHDNWNSETREMEVKDFTYSNPVFAFHNIYNHRQAGVSDEDYIKQPDYSKSPLDFSGNNWYDWNVTNWGTKWDVAVVDGEKYSDTELMEESATSLAYRFNTAWSPPLPAIVKLSEQYPTLNISLSYEEETGGVEKQSCLLEKLHLIKTMKANAVTVIHMTPWNIVTMTVEKSALTVIGLARQT